MSDYIPNTTIQIIKDQSKALREYETNTTGHDLLTSLVEARYPGAMEILPANPKRPTIPQYKYEWIGNCFIENCDNECNDKYADFQVPIEYSMKWLRNFKEMDETHRVATFELFRNVNYYHRMVKILDFIEICDDILPLHSDIFGFIQFWVIQIPYIRYSNHSWDVLRNHCFFYHDISHRTMMNMRFEGLYERHQNSTDSFEILLNGKVYSATNISDCVPLGPVFLYDSYNVKMGCYCFAGLVTEKLSVKKKDFNPYSPKLVLIAAVFIQYEDEIIGCPDYVLFNNNIYQRIMFNSESMAIFNFSRNAHDTIIDAVKMNDDYRKWSNRASLHIDFVRTRGVIASIKSFTRGLQEWNSTEIHLNVENSTIDEVRRYPDYTAAFGKLNFMRAGNNTLCKKCWEQHYNFEDCDKIECIDGYFVLYYIENHINRNHLFNFQFHWDDYPTTVWLLRYALLMKRRGKFGSLLTMFLMIEYVLGIHIDPHKIHHEIYSYAVNVNFAGIAKHWFIDLRDIESFYKYHEEQRQIELLGRVNYGQNANYQDILEAYQSWVKGDKLKSYHKKELGYSFQRDPTVKYNPNWLSYEIAGEAFKTLEDLQKEIKASEHSEKENKIVKKSTSASRPYRRLRL